MAMLALNAPAQFSVLDENGDDLTSPTYTPAELLIAANRLADAYIVASTISCEIILGLNRSLVPDHGG